MSNSTDSPEPQLAPDEQEPPIPGIDPATTADNPEVEEDDPEGPSS